MHSHRLIVIRNSTAIFMIVYGVTGAVLHKWPLRLTPRGRRLHHYESGSYIAAAGLALLIHDFKDLINDTSQ